MTVTYNTEKKELYIDDIGVTMRTMLAVAAKGQAECGVRRWHVVYKEVRIGMVSVKTETLKEKSNGRPAIRVEKRAQRKSYFAETAKPQVVAVVEGSP
jgi:hypothetical protein